MAYTGGTNREGVKVDELFSLLGTATTEVMAKIGKMKQTSNISIPDMFEMQMLMNHLTQLSEMSSSVVSASNGAISSMARNVKS